MLPFYLAKRTPMLVSMQIFLDHARKQISIVPMVKYLFTYLQKCFVMSLLRHYCVCLISFRLSRSCQFFEADEYNTCLRPLLSRKLFY